MKADLHPSLHRAAHTSPCGPEHSSMQSDAVSLDSRNSAPRRSSRFPACAVSLVFFLLFLAATPSRATDLTTAIDVSANPVLIGQEFIYTITIANTSTTGGGPFDSPNTFATIELPLGVIILSVDGGAADCSVEDRFVSCDIGDLAAFVDAAVKVVVQAAVAGTFLATASVEGGLFDPAPANNTATVETSIFGAELSVIKSAVPWILIDDTLRFHISVTNLGPEDATDVQIEDQVSAVFKVVEATTSAGSCDVDANQTVKCSAGDLAVSATARVEITAVANVAHPGRENVVWAAADNAAAQSDTVQVSILIPEDDADGDGVSNRDELLTGSDPLSADYSDLVVTKHGPQLAKNGDEISYEITVTNNGNPDGEDADVEEVQLDDTLPEGLSFLSASEGCEYDAATRLLTCTIGPLATGESKSIEVVARVTAGSGSEIANSAIALAAGLYDTDNLNNISTAFTSVVSAVTDLSVTKDGPGAGRAGDVISFEITVSNAGPDAASNVKVTDVLHADLAFQANGSSTECTAAGQTVTCTVGTLAPGESRAFVVAAKIATTVGQGAEITNIAVVEGSEDESDPAGNNSSPSISFFVERPCRAYVLIGDFNGTPGSGYVGRVALNAADEAQSDYEKAGYTVVRVDSARYFHLRQAVSDPFARAIWFLGHGSYKKTYPVFFDKLLGDPEPGLKFFGDRWVEPEQLLGGPFPQIQQVTLHACGQDLQEWRELFPTAVSLGEWDASTEPTRPHAIYWWQLAATYPPCDRSADKRAAVIEERSVVPSGLHQRLWPQGQYHLSDTAMVYDMAPVTNNRGSFVLEPSMQQIFNGLSFNVLVADSTEPVLLFGAEIEDGTIPVESQTADIRDDASFDVVFTMAALERLFTDPDAWSSTSGVQLEKVASGLDPDSVMAAVGTLLWGYPYESVDLSLRVSGPATVSEADTLTVTVDLANEGPSMVRDSEIALSVPAGLELAAPGCVEEFIHHRCGVGDLQPGETKQMVLDFIVSAAAGEELSAVFMARAVGYGESDAANNEGTLTVNVVVNTKREDRESLPERFVLHDNYPNPFNPSTTISFDVATAARVRLDVYDVLGRLRAVVVDEDLAAGRYDVQFDAAHLPSGVYVYRLRAGSYEASKSMLLSK